jgi:integrase
LLVLTGARRGEVLSLEWADLDLERGIWNRPAAKSKDRKPKRITLSNEALLLLKVIRDQSDGSYLFPTSKGTPMPDLNRPWKWLKQETGLADLRIHDLRHSFASVLISSGETLETIGKLLGHSQHQTTLRYAHLMDDPKRRAANRLSESVVK